MVIFNTPSTDCIQIFSDSGPTVSHTLVVEVELKSLFRAHQFKTQDKSNCCKFVNSVIDNGNCALVL